MLALNRSAPSAATCIRLAAPLQVRVAKLEELINKEAAALAPMPPGEARQEAERGSMDSSAAASPSMPSSGQAMRTCR